MGTTSGNLKKRHLSRKIFFWVIGVILIILTGVIIYASVNFSRLLTDALMKGYNSNIISDVYELKFDKLRVNLFSGNIKVINVVLQPREKPLHNYPYINSSFRLTTGKIILQDVQFMTMVKTGKLELSRIEINKPDIQVWINSGKYVFLPHKDTLDVKSKPDTTGKKFLNSFSLSEFALVDASYHIINTFKEREFTVKNFNIALSGLILGQTAGGNEYSIKNLELAIGELSGKMKKGISSFGLKDFRMNMSGLGIQKSIDTMMYQYADFNTGFKNLNLNTADSVLNITLQSMDLSFADKSIKMAGFGFKPNLSQAEMVRREKYQKAQFTVTVATLDLLNVNFDTLVYKQKLFVDEIKIDKVDVSLYKDKSRPVDRNKFPQYLGQRIKAIPIPLMVKRVKATNVNLVNVERKEDGKTARVTVGRGTLAANNITNLSKGGVISVNASAYIENKVLLHLNVAFSYASPQFSITVRSGKFNLMDLNQLLLAYTPAKIGKGMVDEISLTGTAYRTNATGTMKFLYHDLDVDLKLSEKKWQNDVIAFAANTYLNTNNPAKGQPPIIVQYKAERDMNKGGFNIILKSFLAGMKETMILTKDNKQAYKEAKKTAKEEKKASEGEKKKWNPLKK